MSRLKLPSGLRNQPSKAGVTLAPERRRGSLGNDCADASIPHVSRTAALSRPALDRSDGLTVSQRWATVLVCFFRCSMSVLYSSSLMYVAFIHAWAISSTVLSPYPTH